MEVAVGDARHLVVVMQRPGRNIGKIQELRQLLHCRDHLERPVREDELGAVAEHRDPGRDAHRFQRIASRNHENGPGGGGAHSETTRSAHPSMRL